MGSTAGIDGQGRAGRPRRQRLVVGTQGKWGRLHFIQAPREMAVGASGEVRGHLIRKMQIISTLSSG